MFLMSSSIASRKQASCVSFMWEPSYMLILRSDVVQKFEVPVKCYGDIQKLFAGLACQSIFRDVIFPRSLPMKKGVKKLSFGMCYDLLLHFLFPENDFMPSPQLSYLYNNPDLFSTSEEYKRFSCELRETNHIFDC